MCFTYKTPPPNHVIFFRPQGGKLSSTPHSLDKRGLGVHLSQSLTPSPVQGGGSRSRSGTPTSFEVAQGDMIAPQYMQDMEWKLSLDRNENITIREDFYYDKAPNTSLCQSILDLLNDSFECGGHLLQFAETLSEKLKPIRPGVPNPEVDHSLIISMMRTLLFNAKLKFAHGEESNWVEKCDTYLSTVDLLKLFVANNCADIPSIQELAQAEKARNVRDRLVKSERLLLAMEVSTKCGLDNTAVWSAWGSSCLRAGAYEMARFKFSRVLKTQDILDASSTSIKDFIAAPHMDGYSKKKLDSPAAKECLYYINTYCPYLTAIQFYMKYDLLSMALDYLIKHNCSGEVFLEGLFLPCLKKGELGLCPSSNAVYSFLQERATSYSELFDRLHHVRRAHDHLKAMMEDKEWGSVPRASNQNSKSPAGWGGGRKEGDVNVRLTLSPSDLTKHINTILVQIDVTKFLHGVMGNKTTSQKAIAVAGASATLQLLHKQVLMSGSTIPEGFDLAYRIIQDFRLPDSLIYTRAGRHLASLGKNRDIEQLLGCIKGLMKHDECDEVVANCIRVMSGNPTLLKEAESLIKLINSDSQKINAHIICGKLKKAYLLAVRGERGTEDVKRIASAAERTGNTKIKDMCDQWLKKKEMEQMQRRDVAEVMKKGGRYWEQR
ncbi:putative zinc finger FYVE domain-containing protein 26 [Apostichopus japonicus]|uniref:Putative zinc finger FYVE domain-containing protein 26 n=1 Tax=Stichopus japonicus TaxID=307972 RepID=A0A2G8JF17_STIJA|nr:putative zinc finger FYVE domain-containing protein 26 [Apostichopus japonicus]